MKNSLDRLITTKEWTGILKDRTKEITPKCSSKRQKTTKTFPQSQRMPFSENVMVGLQKTMLCLGQLAIHIFE